MGELIDLTQRLADRSRSSHPVQPVFFFDLACPLSYLGSERVERLLGDVEWIPTAPLREPGGAALAWGGEKVKGSGLSGAVADPCGRTTCIIPATTV